MYDNNIKGRYFLVGCPRSGTTLLQKLLASHSEITSFPESFFFKNLFPSQRLLKRFGIVSKSARPNLMKFLRDSHHSEMENQLPKINLLSKHYTNSFINILDILTLQRQRKIWIEKTPSHLHCIKEIEHYVKGAKFLHIIRNGSDVIASMYEVTNKYPNSWGGKRTVEQCTKRWIRDVEISQSYKENPNHKIVTYEKLVESPEKYLAEICSFLDVTFEEDMLLKNQDKDDCPIMLKEEYWKRLVNEEVKKRTQQKFNSVLTPEERKYVLREISLIDSI